MRIRLTIGSLLLGAVLLAPAGAFANTDPVATDQSVSTNYITPVAFTLSGTDVDGDTLSFSVLGAPSAGSISGTAPNLTYTPAAGFDGDDQVGFRVDDGNGGISDGIVTFHVGPPPPNSIIEIDHVFAGGTGIYGNGSVSFAGLTEGIHLMTVDSTDAAGGHAFSSVHFYIDNTPPTITWRQNPPLSNVQVVRNRIDMRVMVVDNQSTTSDDHIQTVKLIPPDGTPVNFTRDPNWPVGAPEPYIWAKLNFDVNTQAQGSQVFHARATDRAGNLTNPEITYPVIIDYTPPTVAVSLSPAPVNSNGDPVVHGTVDVTVTASDSITSVTKIKLYLSGGSDILLGTLNGPGPMTFQLVTTGYGDGPWTIRAEAYDEAVDMYTGEVGNKGIGTAAIVIDNTSPMVDITAPLDGASGITTLSDIRVTASDLHNIVNRKLWVKKGSGSFIDSPMTYTAPDHWVLNTPLDQGDVYMIRATANDDAGNSGQDQITVTLTGVNHPPTAFNQPASVVEDTAKAITLTGSDPDPNTTLSYIVVVGPTHGSLSGTGANLTYTPAADYNGVDSFTFKVNDGSLDSNIATVSITISPVNDKPVITNGPVTTAEDTAAGITVTGTDVDGDTLSYSLVSGPSHGALSGTMPNLTYTPAANYNGPDSIVVKANDGTVDSNQATVSITVTPVNDAPVANPKSVSTSQNSPKSISVTATDVDGDTLSYAVVVGPSHGSLSGSLPNVTYTPDLNYSGSDSFTFRANDGTVNSNTALVTITVTPVNQAPTANGQSVSTNEDTAKAITLTGSDPENSPLSFEITAQPAHGDLSGTLPNVTYTPDPDFHGSDSFNFRVNDGALFSGVATINVTVNAVNDDPVANPQNLSTNLNTALPITLTGSDADGDGLTYIKVSDPAHGSISGSGASLTYTPANGYTGNDSFLFKVNDGTVDSANALIRIAVAGGSSGGNGAPTANAQSLSTNEDTFKDVVLTGTDPDGDPLSFIIVDSPDNGTLSGSGADRRYTPRANFHGTDTFRFKVNDGLVDSLPATITMTVNAVNDAPVADGQSVETDYQTPRLVTLTGSDVDGDSLSFTVVTGPSHGALSGSEPNVTYTPNAGYSGPDSFTFKANDSHVDSALASVQITVNSQGSTGDNPPVANAQSQSTNEDTALGLTLTGSDPDGDPLTFIIVSGPSEGTLSGMGASRTYTPRDNFHGSDSFRFKVNDGVLDSAVVTVSLTVNSVNDKPIADAQTVETPQDTAILINFTGSDVDGDTLSFIPGTPAHGGLTGSGASRTYTPTAGYNGSDSFTLKANDGTVDSDPVIVRVLVGNVLGGGNHAPVANAQSRSTAEDVALGLTLTGSDSDGDPITFNVIGNPSHGALSGTAPNLTYTPAANYNGPDSFTFRVNDGVADSNLATVSLTVTPVNDAPTVNDDSVSAVEDTPKPIALVASDIDGDTLSYIIVGNPAHGGLSGTGANRTYTPNANYNGPDSFTFRVNDGTVNSNLATVTIAVAAVNDPPVAFINPNPTVGNEDSPFGVTLQATDVEGNAVTYTVLSSPAHGALSGTPPNLTYTPAANYNGPDSFQFIANDGTDDSATATGNLTVTAQNDAPVAQNGSASLLQNLPKSITLVASDVDGDTLSYIIVANPAHGSLSGTGTNRVYTPNANYTGADSFTFKANDGTVDSNVATFSLNIVAGDNAPSANDQSVSTNEDTAKPITLTGSDPDGDTLTYAIVTGPAHGTLSGTAPNVTYTPAADYFGADVFTFKANDGIMDSSPGTVSITVISVNDPPSVTVTTPNNNAYVRGTVPVSMVATDDGGVSAARVKIDAGSEQVANPSGVNLYTFNWNSNAVSEGPHTVEALARDAAALQGSQMISLTVDRTAPQVASFAPADGINVQGTVSVQTSVTDDRKLVFVEIQIDGTTMASSVVNGTAQTLNYSWDTLNYAEGTHQVTVRGVDAAGNVRLVSHDVTVQNLGLGNPLPQFTWVKPAPTSPPAAPSVVGGILTMQIHVTVGQPITSVQFSIDNSAPVNGVNTGPDTWTYTFDTANPPFPLPSLPDGVHAFKATVSNADGSTSNTVSARVDNTPPALSITNFTFQDIAYLTENVAAIATDHGELIDEVLFEINGEGVALRPGNSDPAAGNYNWQMDTKAELSDGTRRWPESAPGLFDYTLTVTAWDKARNATSLSVPFRIDNSSIPINPSATIQFNPTGFVSGQAGNAVWAKVSNATIDPNAIGETSLIVRVKTDTAATWRRLNGSVSMAGNTLFFSEPLPANCRYRIEVLTRSMLGDAIQGSVEGIMAFQAGVGGTVSSADGLLTLTIPPNSLNRDIYVEVPVLANRPQWMEQADVAFNQIYPSHTLVAGPYQIVGRVDMTGPDILDEPTASEISVRHSVPLSSIPTPLQSMLRQIQDVETNPTSVDLNFWHPLGTSSNSGAQNQTTRTVTGSTRHLGIFRVTMFAAPGSGITEIFNYPNPFHPDEGPTSITYMLGDNSDVNLIIYDSLGNLVKKIDYAAGSTGGSQGPNTITWDGKNGRGETVASGAYIARLLAKDSGGGRSKATRKIGVVR